jgi:hypothetical protein
MKHTKLTVITAIIMATISGIVIFSSCSKTSCGSIICQNGGTCSDGKCSCPTGYSGSLCQTRAKSAIQYVNNTFTPITIAVNGSVAYAGQYGLAATGTATTSAEATSLGVNADGGKIGLPINWSINNTFPITDTLRVPLDVGATYFFLKMSNTSSRNIINFYVNVAFPYGEVYQDVTIPNNGTTYDLGYYLAYPSSNVQTQSSNSVINWRAVSLPFTSNQSVTVNIN